MSEVIDGVAVRKFRIAQKKQKPPKKARTSADIFDPNKAESRLEEQRGKAKAAIYRQQPTIRLDEAVTGVTVEYAEQAGLREGDKSVPGGVVDYVNSGDKSARKVVITPPRFEMAKVRIIGTTPLVLHKFSQKVQNNIRETQEAGSQARKGKTRQARDFEENYENAKHISRAGWCGIPASAFRNALISACRTVGFRMTIAKLSLFIVADGFDEQGTGLVRISKGEPHMDVRPGRNANGGIDLRSRPMWPEGWEAIVTFRWDAEQFSASDVINLLARAGQQVGVGEGRPDSKMSAGCGWGEFAIAG